MIATFSTCSLRMIDQSPLWLQTEIPLKNRGLNYGLQTHYFSGGHPNSRGSTLMVSPSTHYCDVNLPALVRELPAWTELTSVNYQKKI
jgi:hypothetical protein